MNYIRKTITQVKSKIRKNGSWSGYCFPNKVNPSSPWYSQQETTFNSIKELEKYVNSSLYYMHPEEGDKLAFYVKE